MFKRLRALFSRGPFAALDTLPFPAFEKGSVWLVGAGPGAPGLISLMGYHALAHADVIVHDALVSDGLLALANPRARLVPAGKRGGQPSPKQAEISERLVAEAKKGFRVLRLKGGDPFMFGRGGEEAGALHAAGVPFRVVPGISAGLGGLAYAGIPVTHRDTNHAVLFLTGHDETGSVSALDWPAITRAAPVLVLFMGVRHLQAIAQHLLAAGRPRDEVVAVVANATLPEQQVIETSLGAAADGLADLPTPAIVVIGPASQHRPVLDWYRPDGENALG